MDMSKTLEELKDAGQRTEKAFLSLSDVFPKLLSARDNIGNEGLSRRIALLSDECAAFGSLSASFWTQREETYAPMLARLNENVAMLSSLEQHVSTIRECSEEMELLSLNAMVISIKSGARGRAFSSITESLRNLSSRMIENSSRLVSEQGFLVESIRSLGGVISALSASQGKELKECEAAKVAMQDVLREVGRPMLEIEERAAGAWKRVAKIMEAMQTQGTARQAADKVALCLSEFKDIPPLAEGGMARRNDIIALDIELCKTALEILEDIGSRLGESAKIVAGGLDSLAEIMEAAGKTRSGLANSLHDGAGGPNPLFERLDKAVSQFEKILNGFFYCLSAQKTIAKDCKTIKAHSRGIFIVFTGLLPVINSLQHVRVLQKIEMAKNDAISSVRNSSDDMDTHIERSKCAIDEMSKLLGSFLAESNELLSEFASEIALAGEEAAELKSAGAEFFSRLREAQLELAQELRERTVFPKCFDMQLEAARASLDEIASAAEAYMALYEELSSKAAGLETIQREELAREGLVSWRITDDSFKRIISRLAAAERVELAESIVSAEAAAEADKTAFL